MGNAVLEISVGAEERGTEVLVSPGEKAENSAAGRDGICKEKTTIPDALSRSLTEPLEPARKPTDGGVAVVEEEESSTSGGRAVLMGREEANEVDEEAEITNRFNKAAENVKKLSKNPTDEELLEIYALFKQGSVGDVNTDRPGGILDFKGKAKWDAWNGKKGTSSDAAKEAYIAKVDQLIEVYGLN